VIDARRPVVVVVVLVVVVVVVVGLGCRGKGDPVAALVESVRAAAEDKDAAAIAAHLTDDFRGVAGTDKAEAAASLRRYFAAYESVRVSVYDVTVQRRTDTEAEVSLRAEMSGAARRIGGLDGFLPPSAVEMFVLRLVRQDGEWKIASAEWRPVEPVATPRE